MLEQAAPDCEIREILADFDDSGVWVYQAYSPLIADAALAAGHFSDGFKMGRATWIKPNLGWMLYRSGYGAKPGQERILRIKVSRDGFLTILRAAVPTTYEPGLFETKEAWKTALRGSEVRYQWDPFRDLHLRRNPRRRALQLGLMGDAVSRYVHDWTLKIEDVTTLAHEIKRCVDAGLTLPHAPVERLLQVDDELARSLLIAGTENR